ncbi:MAG: tetratricopeptide repeat protein [Aquisalimonadaceae bacterium]
MRTRKDNLGLALSGTDDTSLSHYLDAVRQLQCYANDPVATVDAAIATRPDFTMAHVLRAYLHLLGTEPEAVAVARESHSTAANLPMNARERGHVAAVGHLVNGHWHKAGRVLEDVTIDAPRDALALLAGHLIDFYTGHSRMLRDRIARALPAWDEAMPGYHSILGMHAFGLEETGNYALAEKQGRRGVELQPRDGWSQHAVAHVMEMQGRQRDGIAWMQVNREGWATDSFFAVHNWWHLALYHLEIGELEEALALFDGPIHGAHSNVILDMADASALLWRLMLQGIDVGDRWQSVADGWAPIATAGNYAFNDVHAVMALVGAGRLPAAEAVIAAQHEAMARTDDNAVFTRDVGHVLCKAIVAFGVGNYAETTQLIRPIRSIAHRFGGSHAQRDVIDLTLIEAAFRSGQDALARALAAERLSVRPQSPLTRLFAQRAEQRQSAA